MRVVYRGGRLDEVMFSTLVAVAFCGTLITALAATGTKVLYEFSRHDLELYCRRRNHPDLFDEILDRHEDCAVAAESLQVAATVLLVLGAGWGWLGDDALATTSGGDIAAVAGGTILLLLVLTTWIPWAIVHVWSAPFLFHTWSLWLIIATLLWPLTMGARLMNELVRRVAGHQESEDEEEEAFEDEIRSIMTAGLRDGLLEADAREMIEGVIELGDVDVSEIMTPRSEVDAINVELPWPEILLKVADCGRTRIPIYQESLDNVLGILYVKDLLTELPLDPQAGRKSLRQFLRKPWFVPESKAVDDLLREFRRTRSHMAIVVDEYRAVAGVVTIEDALEEIVGEIADESDSEEAMDLIRTDEKTFELDGRIHIDELNEQHGLGLGESEEFDTVAGFVVNAVGRIPKPGEIIDANGFRFTILKASARRVERVRLEILEETEAE